MANPSSRSIGQVLAALKPDFPDISISKIRFLESEGLITPERAPSGYRRYSTPDVERLRYVLTVQRDHYLPLKVIREHLELMDRGQTPPPRDLGLGGGPIDGGGAAGAAGGPSGPLGESLPSGQSGPSGRSGPGTGAGSGPNAQPRPPLRLTRADLLEASGLSDAALTELERNQIVLPRRGTSHYGREALTLAVAARRLSDYGIDGRHLRAFKMSADREIGLVEQAIAPYVRRAAGSKDVSGEVTQLVISFHAALVRTAMER
jgi:DNA-binding transcriptional MerR regulator